MTTLQQKGLFSDYIKNYYAHIQNVVFVRKSPFFWKNITHNLNTKTKLCAYTKFANNDIIT